MGLTIHYRIEAPPETDAKEARRLVLEGARLAVRMCLRRAVDDVGPITLDERAQREGFVFCVRVGKGCEPLWLGLCRYPAVVRTEIGPRQTRLGGRWLLSRFSKTQYASLHGWEHFLRCHRAIIDLLADWRELGLAVRITDEGDCWPRRSERTLRRKL